MCSNVSSSTLWGGYLTIVIILTDRAEHFLQCGRVSSHLIRLCLHWGQPNNTVSIQPSTIYTNLTQHSWKAMSPIDECVLTHQHGAIDRQVANWNTRLYPHDIHLFNIDNLPSREFLCFFRWSFLDFCSSLSPILSLQGHNQLLKGFVVATCCLCAFFLGGSLELFWGFPLSVYLFSQHCFARSTIPSLWALATKCVRVGRI